MVVDQHLVTVHSHQSILVQNQVALNGPNASPIGPLSVTIPTKVHLVSTVEVWNIHLLGLILMLLTILHVLLST